MPFQMVIVANNAAQPFSNVSIPILNGVRFKSDGNNSNTIALGLTGLPASNALTIGTNNATDGIKLVAGDELPVPVSVAADMANIWVIAGAGTQIVYAYGS